MRWVYARNHQLAALFRSMADLLTTQEANPHRIRAYRRAADSLMQLEEDIAAIATRDALHEIPGIGRELSVKIQEFLLTGRVLSYEALTHPLPAHAASWTTLPGLSEPVVQMLYFRLGITTLADLEALVRSHMLRTLPGWSVNEEELLAAIQARQQ